ncbi:VOC family protein [Nocardia pseudovaccinii]|uniref:VOC family protein n=1 Tax=Nocardia pseudovaccinii TaxID=189540 RepID=UPI003D948D56
MNFVGWEVKDVPALDRLIARVKEAGVDITEEPTLAVERGVEKLARCHDPAGNLLEFYAGARIPSDPFVSPTGIRFVTSNKSPGDLGFSHMVVTFDDFDAAWAFYIDLLGFEISDLCEIGDLWAFAHVNPRHHSLAFGRVAGPSSYHHFMLQVENSDMVGLTMDRLAAAGVEFTSSLGRHTNDRMLSFYVRTPSGIELEYGCEGILIDDDTWIVTTHDTATVWGHHSIKS